MTQTLYKKIYPFYVSFLIAGGFAWALANLWFLKNDYSYFQIVTFSLTTFATAVILITLFKELSPALFIRIGVILSMVSSLLLLKFYSGLQPYLIAAISGANMLFLWGPYNIVHFKATRRDQKAFSSSLIFFISPILNIFLPILTGLIAASFGFQINFIVGFLLFILPLSLSYGLPSYKIKYNIAEDLKKISKLRPFLLIEGFWETTIFTAIPIFTLFFIKTPKELGILMAYVAAISAVVSLVFGKVSDKYKKRTPFLYPLTILLTLSTIGLAFATTLTSWIIFVTAISVLTTLVQPFMTALVVDVYPDPSSTMIPREFLLNLGRFIGVLTILGSLLLFDSPKIAFIILGLTLFLYPILLFQKRVYKDITL